MADKYDALLNERRMECPTCGNAFAACRCHTERKEALVKHVVTIEVGFTDAEWFALHKLCKATARSRGEIAENLIREGLLSRGYLDPQ